MRMSLPCAPTAIRVPISRVRSVTETSMMFMIPIPPTTSDTPAIEPSSTVITAVVAVAALPAVFMNVRASYGAYALLVVMIPLCGSLMS